MMLAVRASCCCGGVGVRALAGSSALRGAEQWESLGKRRVEPTPSADSAAQLPEPINAKVNQLIAEGYLTSGDLRAHLRRAFSSAPVDKGLDVLRRFEERAKSPEYVPTSPGGLLFRIAKNRLVVGGKKSANGEAPTATNRRQARDGKQARAGVNSAAQQAPPQTASAAAPKTVESLLAEIAHDARVGRGAANPVAAPASAPSPQQREAKAAEQPPPPRVVEIIDGMEVRELAAKMDIKAPALIKLALSLGKAGEVELPPGKLAQDTRLDADCAATLALHEGLEFDILPGHAKDITPRPPPADPSALPPRPPVVTIMGHVDHGKTTLLDSLRNSSVAAGEAGGITQHIGAFTVKAPGSGKLITFLDTPGHAAFSEMRQRGASVTDVVVLVVAATDGVRPQTLESIKHARECGVPVVVAINKIDADGADPQMAKASLHEAGVSIEENGGDTQCVEISALKGVNLDALEEVVITAAELEGLWSDPTGAAEGVILEAHMAKGEGPVTTALVKRGTLKRGAVLVAGTSVCKVKVMRGPDGKPVKSAGPSDPVEIVGWRSMPEVGDVLLEAPNEKRAKEAADYREVQLEIADLSDMHDELKGVRKAMDGIRSKINAQKRQRLDLKGLARVNFRRRGYELRKEAVEKMSELVDDSAKPRMRFILKSDVVGSEQAIVQSLEALSRDDFEVAVIDAQIGPVTDSDIERAATFDATVLCFNVNIPRQTQDQLDQEGCEFKRFSVIYDLLDFVKERIEQQAPKRFEAVEVGDATVLKVFRLTGSRKAVVAGCRVDNGSMGRSKEYQVVRGGNVVHTGPLSSLKHMQDDVETVGAGQECGLSFEGFDDIREGDEIRCVEMIEE